MRCYWTRCLVLTGPKETKSPASETFYNKYLSLIKKKTRAERTEGLREDISEVIRDRWNSWRFTETLCRPAICLLRVRVGAERGRDKEKEKLRRHRSVFIMLVPERRCVCVRIMVNQHSAGWLRGFGRPFHTAWHSRRHTSRFSCQAVRSAVTYSQSRDRSGPRFTFQSDQTWKTALQKHVKMDEARQAVGQERLQTGQIY